MTGGLAGMSGAEYLQALYARAEALRVPLSASVELTERCNLRCVHCYLGEQRALRARRSRELSAARWREVLDEIADLGCLKLLITGGDPLLRPDFAAIYSHAKQRGLLVTVFTNGTLVDDAVVELFTDLPPYSVEVTLYGATAETYERVTGVPGSYARCMAGVGRLRSAGVPLGLKTVLLETNKHEFTRIAELAEACGTRRFRYDIEIQGAFGGDRSPLSERVPAEEAVRLEQSLPAIAESWGRYARSRMGLQLTRPDRLYVCGAAETGIHVNPYGQLQPCLSVRHIGVDLSASPLAEGIETLRRQLAERTRPPGYQCTGCELQPLCSSCPAFAHEESGAEDSPARYQCRVTHARYGLIEQTKGV